MEEVWKDITLSSLTDNTEADLTSPSPLNTNNHTNNFTLQDFFSRPSSQQRISSPNIIPSTPQNLFNLNSAPTFDFPDSNDSKTIHGSLHFHNQNGNSNGYSITSHRPHLAMNNSPCAGTTSNGNSIDRRLKRMIKNRQSAARSRERRQAYTLELERESEQLKEENKRLKDLNKLLLIAKPIEVPKKRPIFRTYSL